MFLGYDKKNYKKAYFVTEIEGSPKHIKYRYFADLEVGNVTYIGLECVTVIDNEYVPFRELFKISVANISNNKYPDIKEHAELFLQILKTPSKSVLYI
mgnify:CR=1 FL=1